ncbi:MAG: hypothetical protein CTY39_06160 [Hyphomicrobium sp.]|nr:MAG: hypothetical protein CTY39_06160 [Hyphomicrobium sp.]
MAVRSERITITAQIQNDYDLRPRVIGLMIASLTPAIFWTGIIAGMANLAGADIERSALMLCGVATALFAGVACAPIIFRK